MSAALMPPPATPHPARRRQGRLRTQNSGGAQSLLAQGESLVWLTGGALFFCLTMIVGLLALIIAQGAPTFWPQPVVQIETRAGKTYAGEISRIDYYAPTQRDFAEELPGMAVAGAPTDKRVQRRLIRTENFEVSGSHFVWVSEFAVQDESRPQWMVVFERLENGRFYGVPSGYVLDGKQKSTEPEEAWEFYQQHHRAARAAWQQHRRLERVDIGQLDTQEENARLDVRKAELRYGETSPEAETARGNLAQLQQQLTEQRTELQNQIAEVQATADKYQLLVRTASGDELPLKLEQIVRAYPANQLGVLGKLGIYLSRWWEFLSAEPRNVNTEGGVFPAIFGTVAMTLIMSLLVAPFGVLAALYLREYARGGLVVSMIRIAINNLAGVPSIVFGVFGLGFFVYQVGAFVDGGPANARLPVLPAPAWFILLGTLAVLAVAAFACGMFGLSSRAAEASVTKRWLSRGSVALWLLTTLAAVTVIATSPFFGGFFAASLPNPTFGQGGILWSALTLSLLTLPVVIVATEEALAAVPNSMREGSYACGAGKWQTIRRIVLPHALPGIMTGMILAMSRGAGEAAPLMLVGALKFAPKLPVDLEAPFVHANRPFMHLAFHIFDLGFHSPNSEAAKPTVFTTALLLITIVAILNIAAVWLRARLRKQFQPAQF
jgi:ABC-type phosphate transport system permease subunit